MSLLNVAKMLVKKPLKALGLEIVRLRPAATRPFKRCEANEFIWLSFLNINTILDIGAHIGKFAMMIYQILPNALILSFEPLIERALPAVGDQHEKCPEL